MPFRHGRSRALDVPRTNLYTQRMNLTVQIQLIPDTDADAKLRTVMERFNAACKGIDRVSLLTLEGRVLVPLILGVYQAERIALPKGQCRLVLRRDGKWFLIVTVDVPEEAPIPATDFIGVDLGIANIATDSDGQQ